MDKEDGCLPTTYARKRGTAVGRAELHIRGFDDDGEKKRQARTFSLVAAKVWFHQNFSRSTLDFSRRNRLLLYVILATPFILRPSRLWRWPLKLLGVNSTGRKMDSYLIRKAFMEHQKAERLRFESIGVQLPDVEITADNDRIDVLNLNTRAAMRELFKRRELRNNLWAALNQTAKYNCDNILATSNFSFWSESLNICGIPRVAFFADVISHQPPRPGMLRRLNLTSFSFDREEMQQFLQALGRMENMTWGYQDTIISDWALAILWAYGGIFLGKRDEHHEGKISKDLTQYRRFHPRASIELQDNAEGKLEIALMTATPRHPILECFLKKKGDRIGVFRRVLGAKNQEFFKRPRVLTLSCDGGIVDCCTFGSWSESNDKPPESPLLSVYYRDSLEKKSGSACSSVTVKQKEGTVELGRRPKEKLEIVLKESGSWPGWMCNHCLKSALYGSIQKCVPHFCSENYEKLMCPKHSVSKIVSVPVLVNVSVPIAGNRIPRIIHQTWFENLSIDHYPHIARLQNSWKKSGWDYRFYDDIAAKKFITDNFPPPFAQAFEDILPGAYKADYFRYLVLMKDGGIYADVDIMLEANLDSFLTPTLSFFAPRDVVADYAGEPFCLWNGLIGAAPGHPFLVKAVERLVNFIMRRADILDIEKDICIKTGREMEAWKVRSEPVLQLSGPCALGVAANEAMGLLPLSSFDLGWLSLDSLSGRDHGDAMILVGDKFDMGAFRISDPERNFVIAATNLNGVEKSRSSLNNPIPIETGHHQTLKTSRAHYSDTAKGVSVWGTQGVYKDNQASQLQFAFDSSYRECS